MSLSDDTLSPIGGYFELELPSKGEFPFAQASRFQSARAAFLALLRAGRPKRVWMPRYICDSMLAPLEQEGINYLWYELDDQLSVEKNCKIEEGDWLLYINYFGICDVNVATLLKRFAPEQLVFDYSQAFFSTPAVDSLATLYSPRKFFGVPDGGFLISQISISAPEMQDTGSLDRTPHLLKRLDESPEAGYSLYQAAEESLELCEPKRMSQLTERILSSIDFDYARNKRLKNFRHLHEKLGEMNAITIDLRQNSAPLCYPFATQDAGLRNRLVNERIFIATYWAEATDRVTSEWAEAMITNLLPLPIDQRYGPADMERIISIITGEQ